MKQIAKNFPIESEDYDRLRFIMSVASAREIMFRKDDENWRNGKFSHKGSDGIFTITIKGGEIKRIERI